MKQEVINIICKALDGNMPMLVLRGGDMYAREDGDIDILVPSRDALRACLLVSQGARAIGWHLAGFRDIGYLAQIILVRPGSDIKDEAIKIDFFSGFEWYGVGSDAVSRRFFESIQDSDNDAADISQLAAAVNFIQKCLIIGRLSERDWARVASEVSPEYLLETVRRLNLPLSAHDIETRGVSGFRQWHLRAASGGVEGVIGFFLWFPRAATAHLRFKLGIGTHWGYAIGLSGLDGSGKSTQMERLFAAYRKAGGTQPRLVHLLPEWIPMPHQLFRRKKTKENYTRPYAEAPVKSKWTGSLRLGYYLMAFIIAKGWMRGMTERGEVIVLDRSYLDFIADLTRARIPDFQLPKWLIKLCAPSATLLFLDALPETVVRRKGELQFDKAADLRKRYLSVFGLVNGTVIDAEGTPDTVFSHVLGQIDSMCQARLAAAVQG